MRKFLKPSFFLQLIIAITLFDNAEHFKKITTVRRTNTRDLGEKNQWGCKHKTLMLMSTDEHYLLKCFLYVDAQLVVFLSMHYFVRICIEPQPATTYCCWLNLTKSVAPSVFKTDTCPDISYPLPAWLQTECSGLLKVKVIASVFSIGKYTYCLPQNCLPGTLLNFTPKSFNLQPFSRQHQFRNFSDYKNITIATIVIRFKVVQHHHITDIVSLYRIYRYLHHHCHCL